MKRPGLLLGVAIGACVAFGAVVSLYAYKFHARLADDQTLWGAFGEYVGGTLGGIFGLAAFLGVLATLHAQRQQATAGQLQNLLDSTAKTIDRILRARPAHALAAHHQLAERQRGHAFTVEWVLSAAAAWRLTGGVVGDAGREQLREEEINSIRNELFLLDAQFLNFTHCLIEFRKAGGGAGVENVYRVRFQGTVLMLDDVGHLNAATRADFDVDDLRRRQQEALSARR